MAKDAETSKPKHLDPTSEYYLSSQANSATTGDPDRTPAGRPWCTFCHRVGHTQEKCYRRLGIAPPGLPDGLQTNAIKAGSVSLADGITLRHVLYVPNLAVNLIYVSCLATDANCFMDFSNDICVLQDRTSKSPIGLGKMHRGVFMFQPLSTATVASVSESESYELWHQRMGHPSSQPLIHLPTVSVVSPSIKTICDVCCRATHSRTVFPDSTSRAMDIFGLVHCDIWGPYRVSTISGTKYFLTIVDDYSRVVWIYLMHDKGQTGTLLRNFCNMVHTQFGKLVKIIRSDNGHEFDSQPMTQFYNDHGILHQTSMVDTPKQNGRVERKHRHILEVARALRFQANLPIEFRGECVLTVTHLINRTPSAILKHKTPHELLFQKVPSYSHLRVFGCLCDAHTKFADKFAPRSRRCVFLGYPPGKKGWRVYDLETNQVFFSRDVKFEEIVFPFTTPIGPSPTPATTTFCPAWDCAEHPMASPPVIGGDTPPVIEGDPPPSPAATPSPGLSCITAGPDPEISSSASPPSSPTAPSPTLGCGKRQKKVPSVLKDYVCHTAQVLPPLHLQHPQMALAVPVSSGSEPHSYKTASHDPKWRAAMRAKIDALEANGTWTIKDLPPGKKSIGSKWVYKIKFNSDGSLERYKARVVVRGDTQVEGLDYTETFAPVAKMSPRNWLTKLSTALRSYGFLQSHADHTLFTYRKGDVFLSVLVYVDDLILAGNNSTTCSSFKKYLNDCFKLKDLGPLKYFLGIEAARGPRGLFLSQRKYALDILSESGLSASKPAAFPMEQNHGLALAGGPLLSDPGPYRRLIGRLVYLTITRPDICYAVHVLSQFIQSPHSQHWDAALRVLRYLKAVPGLGLFLPANSPLQIYAFCDSNWASCPLTRHAITGYFYMKATEDWYWSGFGGSTSGRWRNRIFPVAVAVARESV
ncbi:hypothetical protein RJ639_032310 [Escallonia herrerae]|uniref:Integrase catalytic domain-containing protein n=1 Tax=Escallonia herrerae TaxID=1293975 RepID=A0AA88X2R4_9ASTE|nr:hypothetical protein RJ639_032310 [Escallonia herrerae]